MNDFAHNKLLPCLDSEGMWVSAESLALRQSLGRGDFADAMLLLKSSTLSELGVILSENGFGSPLGLAENDRENLLSEIQYDLNEACAYGVDGFGLSEVRKERKADYVPMRNRSLHDFAETGIHDDLDNSFKHAEFISDRHAAQEIQKVLKHKSIEIVQLGSAHMGDRHSLLYIAGQGLDKKVQGFAFESIDGKYKLASATLDEVIDLHVSAAKEVAEESVRFALGEWVDGKKVSPIHDLIPDSVSQIFRSTLNIRSAMSAINAIQNGTVREHAGKQGRFQFSQIMSGLGYDINSRSIQQQAESQNLTIVEPNRRRGEYVASIVGGDHKSYLVTFAKNQAFELPISDTKHIADKPGIGTELRIKFKENQVSVSLKTCKVASVER